ncbi:YkgJ family cysteine cluster protein [Moheibacter lacus]|uniref:YkgJ family cysteine cluster protein n=1 Tax=Moheibacter lacus TaxID=2745851 RepID=A0A838ZR95_9FLAO|nr:YkgJ family cysteine cluster protein [Moheibacter lacus]MBA5628892.1 YkgJ family cysteine cluster protein [Moheibacter lacus]
MGNNFIEEYHQKASQKQTEHKKFLGKLKQKPPKDLDRKMLEIHEEVFERIDCLSCANCCKTTGPLFTQKDIERLSGLFRLKPSQFIEKYLRIDEENDYVLQSVPCPFLGADNYCSVYEHRPKACREYPHTDRKKFYQINHLTLKNILICPATYEVVEEMMRKLK